MQDKLKELVVKTIEKFGLERASTLKDHPPFFMTNNLHIFPEHGGNSAAVYLLRGGTVKELGSIPLDSEIQVLLDEATNPPSLIDTLLKELE